MVLIFPLIQYFYIVQFILDNILKMVSAGEKELFISLAVLYNLVVLWK